MAAVGLTIAGCGGQATPGPTATPSTTSTVAPTESASPSPVGVSGSLGEALAYAGPIPRTVDFTDWAAIRASVGTEDLTGASPFEDKAVALRNEATLGGFGIRFLRTQAADWGFDVFDLEWDVVAFVPRRVWFLRFREGFDFAGVAARLESYGFSSEQLAHGVLWTAPQGFPRVGDRIVGNADMEASGFLDDGRTMLASPGGADELRAILTEGPTPLADLSLQSVGRLLGAPFAASIIVPSDCRQLVMQAYAEASPAVRHEVEAMLAAARPLHSPNALGVGYQRTDRPLGRIVVGYAQDGEARDDLERRSTLATMGISAISRDTAVLYRDRLFVVADSRVEERAIVFDVAQAPLPTPTASLPPLAATETLPRLLMGQIRQPPRHALRRLLTTLIR